MAIELSRSFDVAHGSVRVMVQDNLGTVSDHTIYVLGANGVRDVPAAVAQILSDTDAACAALQAAFATAGWTPSGNSTS